MTEQGKIGLYRSDYAFWLLFLQLNLCLKVSFDPFEIAFFFFFCESESVKYHQFPAVLLKNTHSFNRLIIFFPLSFTPIV